MWMVRTQAQALYAPGAYFIIAHTQVTAQQRNTDECGTLYAESSDSSMPAALMSYRSDSLVGLVSQIYHDECN